MHNSEKEWRLRCEQSKRLRLITQVVTDLQLVGSIPEDPENYSV